MEHSVGRPFKVNGVDYVAVVDSWSEFPCRLCVLHDICAAKRDRPPGFGECLCYRRSDGYSVHFEQFGVDFDPAHPYAAP